MKSESRPWLLTAVAVVCLSFDRWLKSIAWGLGPGGNAPFEFALYENHGIAFSLPLAKSLYWPIAVAACVILIVYHFMLRRRARHWEAALVIVILCGAASNLIDRATFGYVVDYLIFFGYSAINLADILIVGGALGLIWVGRKRMRAPAPIRPQE